MSQPTATARTVPAGSQGMVIPFVAAAHEQTAQMNAVVQQSGAASITIPPWNIPAGGFLRAINLNITWTGGVGGTLAADAPWSILNSIQIRDVNGSALFGPMTGYQTALANTYGGYRPRSVDTLALAAGYTATAASGNVNLRIPVEIDAASGLGALPNQLSNAVYQLMVNLSQTTAFGSSYSTAPTFTITPTAEYWTQPPQTDDRGRALAQNPPGLGTTQNWTVNRQAISVGANQTEILRRGNVIRKLILECRDGSGVRSDAVAPSLLQLYMDGTYLRSESQAYNIMNQLEHQVAPARPTGIFVFDFSYFGEAGFIGNDALGAGWLPTTQGTRLEIQGTSASAGTIDVITNDILPVEINAGARFDQTNAGTFQPKV